MLTFPRTGALVGAVPRLNPVVADTTGELGRGVSGKINKRILSLQRRFPQLVVQLVMHKFPKEHPFSMHAFWLFNAAAIAGEGKRGNKNHAIMIVVDPARTEATIVVGYGLEPILRQEALNHLLEMSGPAFQSGKWLLGLEEMLDGLGQLLDSVSLVETAESFADNDF